MGTTVQTRRRAALVALVALALTCGQLVGAGAAPATASEVPGEQRGPEPAIGVTKSVTGGVERDEDGAPYVVVTGDASHDITYDIAITNTGDEDLTDLTLTDDRIGELTGALDDAVRGGVLGVGETVTVTAVHPDVDADTFEEGLLVNVAEVTGTGSESGRTVTARDEATVFDVELTAPRPPVTREEPPAADEGAADEDGDPDESADPGDDAGQDESAEGDEDDDGDDGEVEVLAEVLTEDDADETLPHTGLENADLALLALLLVLLGGAALTLAPRPRGLGSAPSQQPRRVTRPVDVTLRHGR